MKSASIVCITSILGVSASAQAYIVDMTFTGTISEILAPSTSIGFENFAVGDEWRLMFSYESDQLGSGTDPELYSVATPSVLEVFTDGAWIEISDDDAFADSIAVGNDGDVVGGGTQDAFSYLGVWLTDSRVATLILRDPTASVFSDSNPPTDLNLADFASAELGVSLNDGEWIGSVNSVTVIPTPGSAAAFVGLGLLTARRKRVSL